MRSHRAPAKFRDAPGVEQVLICSPDKDLTQCVDGTKVVTLDRRRQIVLDEDGVREKFGVSPESIPDYLALVGDAADGIPGIPRWGAKSAARVLAKWGHIEDIPKDHELWGVEVRGAATLKAAAWRHREAPDTPKLVVFGDVLDVPPLRESTRAALPARMPGIPSAASPTTVSQESIR